MITWYQIGVWLLGILGTTIANILTFLFFTSITSTQWFKNLIVKLTNDFNIIKIEIQKKNFITSILDEKGNNA